jgi:Ser/Thr protein kinase RdoA (MazF antagonist)
MTRDSPDLTPWFGNEPVTISRLGGSGFSGSRVFAVRRGSGALFVLKNFTAATPAPHAAWVHRLMRHLRAAGVDFVPGVVAVRPERLRSGAGECATVAVDPEGVLWELVEFIPGAPRRAPTDEEAATALIGLARLHVAAATLPEAPPCPAASPGIARRIDQARRLVAAPWHLLAPSAAAIPHDAVHERLIKACEIFQTGGGRAALDRIATHEPLQVLCQPVLRDLWSDHVLFADDGRLAGFVDFHAAGCDTPATDLARLLGSWDASTACGRETLADRWRGSLEAYETVRLLSPRERSLIPWLHATGVICGLDNWFRWLITDRREFDDMNRVLARLDRLLDALPDALEGGRLVASSQN